MALISLGQAVARPPLNTAAPRRADHSGTSIQGASVGRRVTGGRSWNTPTPLCQSPSVCEWRLDESLWQLAEPPDHAGAGVPGNEGPPSPHGPLTTKEESKEDALGGTVLSSVHDA